MKKPHLSKLDLTEYELTHEHKGNGFAMVEDIDDEYCRVCYISSPITQVFLAWKPKLKVTTMSKTRDSMPEPWTLAYSSQRDADFMPNLAQVRADLKAGKIKVKDTHFVPA